MGFNSAYDDTTRSIRTTGGSAQATVYIGTPTIYAVVNTGGANTGNITLNPSPNFIGIVTVAGGGGNSGNVTLNPGVNFIGLATTVPTGNVADNAANSGNPVLVGGVYYSTATVYGDADRTSNQSDSAGNLKVTQATLLAGEDLTNNILKVNQVFTYSNITTNATTVVKSGAGLFAGFTVNNIGFTTAGTIAIYDNTAGSGTLIGTWTIPLMPPGSTVLAATFFPPTFLNASFSTGLTFVTASTAPAANITVLYR